MRALALTFIALLTFNTAYAVDRADEVRKAEIAFARAFADRDQAKFFSFVADDANFLGPKRTLSGKDEVKSVWTNYLKDPQPPFSWEPERVVVNRKGDLGLSTGPIHDAAGKHIGNYSSIWQRQRNGTWKVIFDGPGAPVCDAQK
jgi:ketosteroid isomerase-like protein